MELRFLILFVVGALVALAVGIVYRRRRSRPADPTTPPRSGGGKTGRPDGRDRERRPE